MPNVSLCQVGDLSQQEERLLLYILYMLMIFKFNYIMYSLLFNWFPIFHCFSGVNKKKKEETTQWNTKIICNIIEKFDKAVEMQLFIRETYIFLSMWTAIKIYLKNYQQFYLYQQIIELNLHQGNYYYYIVEFIDNRLSLKN